MVLSSAPHPNAAQVLADFMVSPQGQQAVGTGTASALPVEGAIADAQQIPDLDPKLQTADAVTAYQEKWEAIFR